MSHTENLMLGKILNNQSDILVILICLCLMNMLLCLVYIVHGLPKHCVSSKAIKDDDSMENIAVKDSVEEDETPNRTGIQKPCMKAAPKILSS